MHHGHWICYSSSKLLTLASHKSSNILFVYSYIDLSIFCNINYIFTRSYSFLTFTGSYIFWNSSIAFAVTFLRALVLDADHQAFAYWYDYRDGCSLRGLPQHRFRVSKQRARTGSVSVPRQWDRTRVSKQLVRTSWFGKRALTVGSNLRAQGADRNHGSGSERRQRNRKQHSPASQHTDICLLHS